MKRVLLGIAFVFFSLTLAAQSVEEALTLIKESRFTEAVGILKEIEGSHGNDPQWFLALAAAYEKQGLYTQAVDILKQGYYRLGNHKELGFNLANNLYALGRWEEAIDFYNQVIAADSFFSAAYLNRGNSFLKLEDYQKAVEDYRQVLVLAPAHPQKISIERMISLLTEEQRAAVERERLVELQRLEQERRLTEMREQVASELSDLDQSKNLQVDNTNLEDYMFNLDIME